MPEKPFWSYSDWMKEAAIYVSNIEIFPKLSQYKIGNYYPFLLDVVS